MHFTDSHTQPPKRSVPLKYIENTIIMVNAMSMAISVTNMITEPHQHVN